MFNIWIDSNLPAKPTLIFLLNIINHKDINRNVSYEDLTEIILSPFIGNEIESDQLKRIIKEAYSNNFTESGCVSFKELNANEIIVELFNGPTLAFKDFAMQLLIPLFDHFLEKEMKRKKRREVIFC